MHRSDSYHSLLWDWSWPALRRINLSSPNAETLRGIASQRWAKNLTSFQSSYSNQCFTAGDLRSFLLGLGEDGDMESLYLCYFDLSRLFSAFDGIKLENLERLSLSGDFLPHISERSDISAAMHSVFDTCYFPKLKHLGIENDQDDYDDCKRLSDGDDYETRSLPKWLQPPKKAVNKSFLLLKGLNLKGLSLSRGVADYLGIFRRAGGDLFLERACEVVEIAPSEIISTEHQQLLRKLDISCEQWADFTENYHDPYQEYMYWKMPLSDKEFKLTAYAAALDSYGDGSDDKEIKLQRFLQVFQSEFTGNENILDALRALKKSLEKWFPTAIDFESSLEENVEQIRSNMDYLITWGELFHPGR